jgi:hypothetical protein
MDWIDFFTSLLLHHDVWRLVVGYSLLVSHRLWDTGGNAPLLGTNTT